MDPAEPLVGGSKPARVIGPSRIANTGLITGPDGSVVAVESYLEADYILLLGFDPDVTGVQTQPVTLQWTDGAERERSYTPDMIVYYRNRKTELVEIKHTTLLKRDLAELKPKFCHAVNWARHRGWRFRVVTERRISPTLIKNLKFLDRYRRRGIQLDPEHASMILAELLRLADATPDTLMRRIARNDQQKSTMLPSLWKLIVDGAVRCDLMAPLTMSSPIWLEQNPHGDQR